tara:strand:+ start:2086 stop:5442 length:3357 start_codon:yes stop_codon:yes gene_type:complete
MFIITALTPLVSVYTSVDDSGEQTQTNPFGEPILLDDLRKDIRQAVGQPCPAIQNDGGSPGDAGNATTNTAKDLGSNPTTSFTSCADTTDIEDWYEFTMDQDYNIDVTMSNYQNDYDLALAFEDNGSYFAADTSYYGDPVETVTSIGSSIESTPGTYWIVVFPYNQGTGSSIGDYDLDIWTNYTEACLDWLNPQNDANTGQDAPQNWTESPTNMGSNVTATYTGCLDSSDGGDVFAFDVPENHTIAVSLSMDSGVDFDLLLHQPNGSIIDTSGASNDADEFVTSMDSSFENQPGTYYVNISHFSGNGNYTLDVYTNFSVPIPNLAIDDVIFPQAANLGDVVPFDISVINDGTLDLVDPFMTEVILSVDSGNSWVDHNLGNITWSSGLAINTTQLLTLNATVPSNLVQGEYNVFIILDGDEMVAEKSETDNTLTAADSLTVGNGVNACASPQDDAASGADVGDDIATSLDLGLDIDAEVRGCVDSTDEADLYKVSISANQPLEITLVTAPIDGADFDLELFLPNGTSIDRSWRSTNIDETVTLEGTDYEAIAGDYYVNVTYWGGFGGNPGGTYRLLIGEPDQSAYVPPFTCGSQNDLGLGQDATSSGIPLGRNPSISGTGCLSNSDTEDVFNFEIEDYKNTEIHFNASANQPFTATLTNAVGDLVATVDNQSYGLLFSSLDNMEYEGQATSFTLTVDSNGGQGDYDVDIIEVAAALPDVVTESLSCPTSETFTDEEITIQWTISNMRGPGYGQTFVFMIELVNSDNESVNTMYSSETASENPGVTNAMSYNASSVDNGFAFFNIPTETTSGDYRCKIILDTNDDLPEENESNNVHFSEPFYIQNEEELWANDVDRDTFNSTDAGDGIIDDCPNNPGTSTIDRYGCPDLDSDGVSNDNDILPNDPTQYYDSDGDGFGDNPTGTNGDMCPDVAGVFSGDDGRGCPILDLDFDGVLNENDLCPETPIGVLVDSEGCEIVEEPQDNSTDDGDDIIPVDPTDPTDPVDPADSSDDATDSTDEAESESGLFGMSYTLIGIIGIVVVLLIATLLFVRGRGSKSDAYAMQEKAYADAGYAAVAGIGAVDASITPEQLAYEQQLIAAGYPADYARAYADQHFRPWLKQ